MNILLILLLFLAAGVVVALMTLVPHIYSEARTPKDKNEVNNRASTIFFWTFALATALCVVLLIVS